MTSLFPIILLLLFPSPQAPPWEKATIAEGRYSFEMPAPAREVPSADLPKTVKQQTTHFCKVDGSLFSFQTITMASPIPAGSKATALARERDEYIRNNAGKVIDREQITLDGHPGWEFTLEGTLPGDPGLITSRVRMYLVDSTYCIQAVMSPRDAPLPDDSARFLDSFQITPKP